MLMENFEYIYLDLCLALDSMMRMLSKYVRTYVCMVVYITMAANSNLKFLSFYFSVSFVLLGRWFNCTNEDFPTLLNVDARQFVCVQLRKALLWKRVRCDKFVWFARGKPAWVVLVLLLAGDVELNPGPGIPRCCRCNRNATCNNCKCAKAGKFCIGCLPKDLGGCINLPTSACPSQQGLPLSHSTASSVRFPSRVPIQSSVPFSLSTSTALSSASAALSLPHTSLLTDASIVNHLPVSANQSSFTLSQPVGSLDQPATTLPSLNTITSMKVPTLQHVPKGARDAWARVVGEALEDLVSQPASIDVWSLWFMLPRCILYNPPRGGRSHWTEKLKIIRGRIKRWRDGDHLGLWHEVLEMQDKLSGRRRPKKISPESMRSANARRARRAMEDGQYRKATQALTSDGLAEASPEVLAEMLAKHPQDDLPLISHLPLPTPIKIDEATVVKAMKSFPNGTAPGPSALRANHLKEAVFCPSPDRANTTLKALSRIVNILISGQVPPEVVPHLCGATLLATKKKSGGFRPIAVGEVLRRLTSKCVSKAIRSEAFEALTPLQLGVGVSVGCESIVHAVNCVLEDSSIKPEEKWTLLDKRGAPSATWIQLD